MIQRKPLKGNPRHVWDKISFRNPGNNGDMHVSRSFVKYIVDHSAARQYEYQHRMSNRLFLDIPELKIVKPYGDAEALWRVEGNNLYINTWYGVSKTYSQHGPHFETLYKLFGRVFAEVFHWDIANIPRKFMLPYIDFNWYETNGIDAYLALNARKWRKKIFYSNGPFLSGQGIKFDINGVLRIYAERNPDVLFLVTEAIADCTLANVVTTASIIQVDGCDLNENAYLSQFCDVILGQGSGPYTFAYIQSNLQDTTKLFVAFAAYAQCAMWVQPWDHNCSFMWVANTTNIEGVMQRVLA